jgi:hypothetical protein
VVQAAAIAYTLRIDPLVVLDEPDTWRRQVREACAMVIVRERNQALDDEDLDG